MESQSIVVRGAREHNLKDIDVEIPRNKITVITGVSGSGKSTLAFDTIYAEGQRRYVESLSAYARQFLGLMNKPDVDSIEGLSPAISIQQKAVSNNPRSTVGTITEIFDYLRLLFARVGTPHCPKCGKKIEGTTAEAIVETLLREKFEALQILAPIVRGKKGTYESLLQKFRDEGFSRARADGKTIELEEETIAELKLAKYEKHDLEIIVDRMQAEEADRTRAQDAVETGLKISEGGLVIAIVDGKETLFSRNNACSDCGISIEEIQPRLFSFNSPFGACPECNGLGLKQEFDPDLIIPDKSKSLIDGGIAPWNNQFRSFRMQALYSVAKHYGFDLYTPIENLSKEHLKVLLYGSEDKDIKYDYKAQSTNAKWSYEGGFEGVVPQLERLYGQTESEYRREEMQKYMRQRMCPKCKGKRLKPEALAVKIGGKSIIDVTDLAISDCLAFFSTLEFSEKEKVISKQVLKEINARLLFLHNVGLTYLTLSRQAGTLSGGEAQRIRLATQIGSQLTGVLYVLDEPSIGLHQRDNKKLLDTLKRLRDLGNTVLVVEHDEETIQSADYVIDLGPGAGVHGGKVVAAGTPKEIAANKNSLTGAYLRGERAIKIPKKRREFFHKLWVKGARENNLKGMSVGFPLGAFTCVTGVSGSGKSSLVMDVLYKALARRYYNSKEKPGEHDSIEGTGFVDNVILVDQSPIGRTPRSNPATYTGVFTPIRELFASTPDARTRGFDSGRFSFNVAKGRCEACEGDGVIRIEMQFLPDVYVQCEQCKGKRYDKETLSVYYKGKNISEVLDLTVEEGLEFFKNIPQISTKLETIRDVGLGYIKLGQQATTLSGGEAQRIKLAAELSKRSGGDILYLLDEPTTGLHFADIEKLLDVLHRLVDKGNTAIVIEHNLDVIKTADYVIDLGPEGGEGGGRVVASGTPEEIAKNKHSHTGEFLKKVL
ncbi:MAG: excinuclease ABC subunit UvrA [Candidatus Micrarchaeia archaeon]|jgi:excinuclease ABC subunit A